MPMNEQAMVTVYVVIDDTLKAMGHTTDKRAIISDANVLTVAVPAAQCFQNHQERTWVCSSWVGISRGLGLSRFNRRLHAFSD